MVLFGLVRFRFRIFVVISREVKFFFYRVVEFMGDKFGSVEGYFVVMWEEVVYE